MWIIDRLMIWQLVDRLLMNNEKGNARTACTVVGKNNSQLFRDPGVCDISSWTCSGKNIMRQEKKRDIKLVVKRIETYFVQSSL